MPIYEYACTGCARSFEELVIRKSDEAEVRCPTCGSRDVARQMSRPAAVGGGGGGESYAGGRAAPSCGPIG